MLSFSWQNILHTTLSNMATFQWIKKWKLEYYVYFIWNFFFFCHILFFLQKLNKQKISLSFIYPPPIFLKNLSDNKDILYLFFSINMCKNILMKKMYLCLLNIRHTKKKRRKKSLPFTLPPSWTLSFGRLWASMNVDAFEKEKKRKFTMHFNFSSNVPKYGGHESEKILLQALIMYYSL